jgi:hypothetical protein
MNPWAPEAPRDRGACESLPLEPPKPASAQLFAFLRKAYGTA